MNFKKFRPDPYEEDLRFAQMHYCFGGDGGDGGGGGDDGSSGDDYGSDGFAGDTDASIGGGYAEASSSGSTDFSDEALDSISASFDAMNASSYSVSGMTGGITGFDSMADAESFAEFNQAEAQFEALNNATTGITGINAMGVVQNMPTISPTGYSRASYEDAAFFADVTNQAFNFDQEHASSFMSDPTVVNPETGFIGQVTSDNSLVDAVVNFLNPIPMTKVDTAQVIDATGKTTGTYSLTQAGVTGYGMGYGQMVSESQAAAMQAAQSAAEAGLSGGADQEYVASVKAASPYTPKTTTPTTPFRSAVRASAMRTPTPSMMYSDTSDPFGYFNYQRPGASYYLFAEGGDVDAQMLEMQKTQAGAPTGDGPTGFVESKPENLDDATKVADDVPVDVEEGSFVINAAAVEFAGSEDIKKMIVDAIAEARNQGIDISGDENKIDRENAVSLLVSRGEVVIPPILAKIIGYDKLNKINNRGKKETEERLAENGQAPEQPQNPAEGMQMAAMGLDTRDTDVIDIYSSIQSQGGEPGQFETFRDAMDLYKGTKTYRPMETQPGTPEFDAEVRDKYKLFFADNPNPYMNKEERDAAKAKDKANLIDKSEPLARVREDGSIYYIDRKTGKEVPAPAQGMAGGGFAEAIEKHKDRGMQAMLHDIDMTDGRSHIAGEIIGDGFAVKGNAHKSKQAKTTEYPDGVVVDEENKNLGFALNGELFLFDDTWLNAGIEKNRGSNKGTANIPTGDKVQWGDQFEMTRYNMGATFGDLSLDVSGMPGEGIDRGRVKYKLNKNRDELFIEGDESGNISAGLRLSI